MATADPDGKVIHVRFTIGNSLIILSDGLGRSSPDRGQMTLHIYTRNVDKLWKDALEAGAKVSMPLDDMYWGERYGQLVDPLRKSMVDLYAREHEQEGGGGQAEGVYGDVRKGGTSRRGAVTLGSSDVLKSLL